MSFSGLYDVNIQHLKVDNRNIRKKEPIVCIYNRPRGSIDDDQMRAVRKGDECLFRVTPRTVSSRETIKTYATGTITLARRRVPKEGNSKRRVGTILLIHIHTHTKFALTSLLSVRHFNVNVNTQEQLACRDKDEEKECG